MSDGFVKRLVSRFQTSGQDSDDSDSTGTLIDCVIVTCPICENQRPFEISREKYDDGREDYRFERGIGLHLAIAHRIQGEQSEELSEEAIKKKELTKVPKTIIDQVDKKSRKWRDDYTL
jgi:hypothetical protein